MTQSRNPVTTAPCLLLPFLLWVLWSQGQHRFQSMDSWGIPDSLRPLHALQVNLSPKGAGPEPAWSLQPGTL